MPNSSASAQTNSGIINALAAYFMWGLAPMYFKALTAVGATEILIHRVVWSTLLLLVIVVAIGKWQPFVKTLTNKKVVASLAVTATLLGSNWYIFIWAVNNDHLLDASLGYYINPIFNVALGMIFLGERLRKWQGVAVALAIVGVLIQVAVLGTIPMISLVLAATFGIYALVRKKLHIDSFVGLLIESLLLLPVALLGWLFFVSSDTSNMLNNSWSLNTMLLMAGVITTAPLLCFTAAAKRLTLATLGFFQYIGPSIMFMLATFYYQEVLAPAKLATFACIWAALVIYSVDSLRARKARKQVTQPTTAVNKTN
ncbi:EamA family transporter RarD [Thalassotalea euphylliae]|uniref:EamA family transporter RarD n=1 Tax=Thalassotalea euphylliae TaxID=1655234 RepID=A0A3E0TVH7_9GAMM|nr:EamA family transporter RarD [Thalassotalea euphylliae]REL28671.1 EamA family transporter RarD [Thalassotalea euphylliae]